MVQHSKRYRLDVHKWGYHLAINKYQNNKEYFNVDRIEFDTEDELNEFIQFTEETFADIERPDCNCTYKVKQNESPSGMFIQRTAKSGRWSKTLKSEPLIYDDTHFWWGYAVFDFEAEKIIKVGGFGLKGKRFPQNDLALYDDYFRKPGEIPEGYVWDDGEYAGWLQFRWGDGENAIEKVKARKLSEAERAAKLLEKKNAKKAEPKAEELSEDEEHEAWANSSYNKQNDEIDITEYDIIEAEFERELNTDISKERFEKYGW